MTQWSDFKARIDAIEEAYEHSLGYAAQGLSGDQGSASGQQLRTFLERAADAIDRLAPDVRALIAEHRPSPAEPYGRFADVIEADARAAGAAVRLVLAQDSISSQLVDNLNASIHLRALLTDLFLVDDVLKRLAGE